MTRENKAGLVVCGSFLCLVAAVVAVKLRQPPASDTPPTSPTLAMSSPVLPAKEKGEASEAAPHPAALEQVAAPIEAAPVVALPPAPAPPPGAPLPEALPAPVQAPAQSKDPPDPPGPLVKGPDRKDVPPSDVPPPLPTPPAPLPVPDTAPLPPLPGHEIDPPMTPAIEPPGALPAPTPLPMPPPVEPSPEKKDGPATEAPGGKPKKDKHPKEGGENVVSAPPTAPPDPISPPSGEPKNPKRGGDNSVSVPPVQAPAADPDGPPKPAGPAAPEPLPAPPLPGPPEPLPPPPGPKPDEPPALPTGVRVEPPSPSIVPPAPGPKSIKVEPSSIVEPSSKDDHVVVIPPGPPESPTPPVAVMPPARAQSPGPAAPLVDSWDEQTYVCRAGDDYTSVSKAIYKADGYGRALELYNRNHPRASDAMRTTGTLAPGEKIYIPPSEILEKRHGDAIAKTKPAPVGSASPPGSGAVQAGFQTVAPVAGPTYTVKAPGERLYQIAARVLGDGQRWSEIGDLNRGINPEAPVPPGTVLKLPAGARVPPAPGS